MSADVESQSPGARPRGRCLDAFLTGSVIALFVLLLVALGGALLFARHLEREMNARMPQRSDAQTGSVTATRRGPPGPGAAYKVQNFAYLRATHSELRKGVMSWESIPYGEGQSIGALYTYEKQQSVLNVMAGGSYFLYVQLTFSCTHICPAARFTVSFYDQRKNQQLTCAVSLPKQPDGGESRPVSQTCWRVVTLLEQDSRLLAKAEFSEKVDNWKLELNDSGFGMFLVDR